MLIYPNLSPFIPPGVLADFEPILLVFKREIVVEWETAETKGCLTGKQTEMCKSTGTCQVFTSFFY